MSAPLPHAGAAMPTPLCDFVRQYQSTGAARLHMPGHKGKPFLGCEPWDITEIAGADELYDPAGPILASEANATALFGSAHTYYATEGSSQCIRAMLYLAVQAAPPVQGRRPLLLAARNAHKALLYAAALLDLDVEWLWPEEGSANSLCSCAVSPGQLRQKLAALAALGRRPFACYFTSPDYLGGMQDIAALAAQAHAAGIPLLMDNAHGAYLRFLPQNLHPLALGADLCCDSAHKTLPVLTGGAYLHVAQRFAAAVPGSRQVRGALALFGSTSPSYLILQSLDLCNRYLAGDYPTRLAGCVAGLQSLRSRLQAVCPGVVCPTAEPLKLVLDAARLGMAGGALADALRAQGAECEYAGSRHLVLMFTPENTAADAARVVAAVEKAAQSAPGAAQPPAEGETAALFAALAGAARQVCSVRQAMLGPQQFVPAAQALGRVCAMPTVSCPPAVPIVVSGEQIGPEAVALFARYQVKTVAVACG